MLRPRLELAYFLSEEYWSPALLTWLLSAYGYFKCSAYFHLCSAKQPNYMS